LIGEIAALPAGISPECRIQLGDARAISTLEPRTLGAEAASAPQNANELRRSVLRRSYWAIPNEIEQRFKAKETKAHRLAGEGSSARKRAHVNFSTTLNEILDRR
jgi:hypothetical protein